MKNYYIYSFIITLLIIGSNNHLSSQSKKTENYILHDNVILVSEESNRYLQTKVSVVLNSAECKRTGVYKIEFSNLGRELENAKTGDILTCANAGKLAPYGYAGKIVRINKRKGNRSFEFELRPATIQEIFRYLDYSVSNESSNIHFKSSNVSCNGLTGSANTELDYDILPGVELGLEFDVSATVDLNINIIDKTFGVPYPRIPDKVNLCASISGSIKPTLELELSELTVLPSLLDKVPSLDLPPITLYGVLTLEPQITPILLIDELAIENQGDEIEFKLEPMLTFGLVGEVGYDDGWYRGGDLTLNGSLTKPIMSLDENEGVTVSLQLRLSYHPYGLDDTYIGIAPEINTTVSKTGCQTTISPGAGIQFSASLGFEWDNPGPGSIDISFPPYKKYLWRDTDILSVTLGNQCPSNNGNISNTYVNCNNGYQDYAETGVDCGGNCPPCYDNTVSSNSNFNCQSHSNFTYSTNGTLAQFQETSTNSNQFLWIFDDGSHSFSPNPSHTFSPGIHKVCLHTASTACYDNDWMCENIYISGGNTNPPIPSNICQASAQFQGWSSNFSADFQIINPVNVDSYYWTFGDGSSSSAMNPSHTYANNGTYNVCLTINGCGESGTGCSTLAIDVGSCAPNHIINYPLNIPITYEATNYIFGKNVIHSNGNVTFNAGNQVVLENGFWAKPNSDFRAYINGCGNYRLSGEEVTNNFVGQVVANTENTSEDEEIPWINVYPNPFEDYIIIDIGDFPEKKGQLILYDISGKKVWEENITTNSSLNQINTSLLTPGVYLLQVNTGKRLFSKKIIK